MNKLKKYMKHRIDPMSIFLCTVYKIAYYIVSALFIILPLNIITYTQIKIINTTITYWLAIFIYFLAMYILYKICKLIKIKKNKLSIEKLSIKNKFKHIVLMLICTFVISALTSVLDIIILTKSIV